MYGPSMCSPAIAGCAEDSTFAAHAANDSNDEVMIVGRHCVTPVARIAVRAPPMDSGVASGSLKSTPPKPLTCKSKNPGHVVGMGMDGKGPCFT